MNKYIVKFLNENCMLLTQNKKKSFHKSMFDFLKPKKKKPSDTNISFSRLLKIFEINYKNAYIFELIVNGEKKLYISYYWYHSKRQVVPYEKKMDHWLKKYFKSLSKHCLMSECEDASYMFQNFPITHFEADCSSLTKSISMFECSKLEHINAQFPKLVIGHSMFKETKLKKIEIDFPNLEIADQMFFVSSLEYFKGNLDNLKTANLMFSNTDLKEFNSKIPKIEEKYLMFNSVCESFKEDNPYLFL